MTGRRSNASEEPPATVTVRVPMTFRKQGGRRLIIRAAEGWLERTTKAPASYGSTVRALVRAYRWRTAFEVGQFNSITEFAAAQHVDRSYISKMMRLTLLSPVLIERILEGIGGAHIEMQRLLAPFPIEWEGQRSWLCDPVARLQERRHADNVNATIE